MCQYWQNFFARQDKTYRNCDRDCGPNCPVAVSVNARCRLQQLHSMEEKMERNVNIYDRQILIVNRFVISVFQNVQISYPWALPFFELLSV